MLSSKHRVLTIVLVLTIVAIVGTMVLSACQIKLNNPPKDNDNVDTPKDEQGTTPDTEQDTEQDTDHNQDADQDTDNDQDSTQEPPAQEKTEAEYKAMFLEQLPTVIENYFNENLAGAEWWMISNCQVKLFNVANGTIYFYCTQDFCNVFMSVKSQELSRCISYKELYNTINNCIMTTDKIIGELYQTETLANEIAEFALEQAEVVNYLAENGLNASNYEVLNATEFSINKDGYNTTSLVILSENKIISVNLLSVTGSCSSQEEYINQMKNGKFRKAEFGNIIDYQELALA